MSKDSAQDDLSRRERQIMDLLLERGEATADEVREGLPDAPGNSAVRAMLTRLERKGKVRHTERNLRYVYRPTVSRTSALSGAVKRLVRVFFGGSVARAVTGMVDMSADRLEPEEIEEIQAALDAARRRRRGDRR